MSAESNKELVRRFLEEVIIARNVSAIPEFMVAGSMFSGAFEGFVNHSIKVAFPDFQLKIEDVFSEGDKALVQTTFTVSQMGAIWVHPPSGKTYSLTLIYIFKIANGKIISGQWVTDRLEASQQLGWIPMPS